MTGADVILETAVANGVDICFANAGTTEIPVVAALDRQPGIRAVLGLFEGVCTGAADGYGRVLYRPAMTLLHLGPGFANGIACLHDARRAQSPIVNLVGEHASWHRDADPPLHSDIKSLARTVSGWVRTSRQAGSLSADTAAVIAASRAGQIASLIVPTDFQASVLGDLRVIKRQPAFKAVDKALIKRAAMAMSGGKKTAMLLGNRALRRDGLAIAQRVSAATGCDLLANTFPGYIDRGDGLPVVKRVPYFPEGAMALMSGYETVLLVGAHDPVTFFGYEGTPSRVIPRGTRTISIPGPGYDLISILENLEDRVGKKRDTPRAGTARSRHPKLAVPAGILTPETVCSTVAAVLPEGAIVVDEGITTTFPFYSVSYESPPHSLLTIAGGSIGYGMPCAAGASFAAPGKPVINIQADGSAMYTVQALWTMARENLNVTTLICNNGGYNIIAVELERAGLKDFGENARRLVDIDRPVIDWVALSQSLGVPAVRVEDAKELAVHMKRCISEPGPHLIEMIVKTGNGQ
jgi:acetolactate synthase I/II/III large subunit